MHGGKGECMTGEWKVLRGGKGKPLDDAPPRPEREEVTGRGYDGDLRAGQEPGSSGENSGMRDRYGSSLESDTLPDRYREKDFSPATGRRAEDPVPKKHFIIAFCILGLVCFGWLFKKEVRGVASWAVAAAQGKDVPLSARAPGLAGLFRFNKPYAWDEFLAVCRKGGGEAVRKILDKQPELMRAPDGVPLLHILALQGASPDVLLAVGARTDDAAVQARDAEGRTLLHLLASGGVDPTVLRALGGRNAEQWVNARDKEGRTPLHIAAGSTANPSLVLAFRGMGASPALRDNAGRIPLDYLLETWGGMPRSVTGEERKKFSEYGYNVAVPFSRRKDGSMETKFVTIAEQVGDTEGKRYFTLFAEAHNMARESGFSSPDLATGDLVGRPPNKEMEMMQSFGMNTMDRMRERNRPKGSPLWKAVTLADGTGAAMAKFKCLYPEAYPTTVNAFSAALAGKEKEPSFEVEWDAWDVPATVRLALMMQMIQERLQRGKPQANKPNAFTFGGGNMMATAMQSYREVGDAPQARNPLLMVWTLLEYDRKGAPGIPASLNVSPTPPPKNEKGEGKAKQIKELPNLRGLHARLPREVWQETGRHLVAAAYVSEKNQDGQWGGGMMPPDVKKAGGLASLRLWGNEDRTDPAEPLRRVLDVSASVAPELAEAMAALVLRSGPQSAARGKDGKTPLEYAGSLPKAVPGRVKALLRAVPVYEPPAAVPERPAPREGRPVSGARNPVAI